MGSFNEDDYISQLEFNKKVLEHVNVINDLSGMLTLIIYLGQYIMFTYARRTKVGGVNWITGANTVYEESSLSILRTLSKLRNAVCHMSSSVKLKLLIDELYQKKDELYLIDDIFIQEKAIILLNSQFTHLLRLLDEDKKSDSSLNLALDSLMCL